MSLQPVVFRTKVDRWLVVVLAVALGSAMWAAVATLLQEPAAGWVALAVVAGSVLLVAALSIPTEYVVADRELVLRFGLVRMGIPLDGIERVYPTRNPLSAPAWSLDRLGVRYRRGHGRRLALISPAQQEAFLALLAERAGLRRQGAELLRADPAPPLRA